MNTLAQVQPTTNTKRQKFVQLAEARTGNAIKAIRLIGNLSNRASYDYGELDIKKITAALDAEIEAVKAKMTALPGNKSEISFKL